MENKIAKKSKFNFIDAIIIVLALAMIAALIYFFTVGNVSKTSGSDKTVIYTLKIPGVNADYLSLLKENDVITDSSSGNKLGTVKEVRYKNALFVGDTVADDGKGGKVVSHSEYDNLYDVYVTLYVTATLDSRGIAYVGTSKILVGSPFYVRDGSFAKKAFCTDFSIE